MFGACKDTSHVLIENKRPYIDAGEDQVVYQDYTRLNANNPGTIKSFWDVVGTSTARFEQQTYFNTTVTHLSPGLNTLKWSLQVDDCVVSDNVVIDYRHIPIAQFTPSVTEGCYPLTVTFQNNTESITKVSYYWDFGDGNSSGNTSPTHIFEYPGLFTVTLIVSRPNEKDATYTALIDVWDHPVANFSVQKDVIFIPDDKGVFFDRSTDAVTWLWCFDYQLNRDCYASSTDRNPIYKYENPGFYDVSLEVSNKYGCTDFILVNRAITVEMQGWITFPNAFMPYTSSDHSKAFKPAYSDVDKETFLLQIFNRLGQLIFETRDIDEGWDGYYQGQLAAQAVYTFTATGSYISGKQFRESGTVMLVR